VITLIPARIGSKDVPLKNLRDLGGYPLLAWSIAAGRLLGYPVVVSSDSDEILGITNKYSGTRHKRANGGSDIQTDIEVVADFIRAGLNRLWGYNEIIYLRPTTPFRNPVLLKKAVDVWNSNPGYSSLCSGHILSESADKYLKRGIYRGSVGYFDSVVPYNDNIKLEDIHNPRQFFTETIQGNGVIDIFKTGKVAEGVLWGKDVLGFLTPKTIEIDTEEDLEYCNWLAAKKGHPLLDYMRAIW